MKGSSRYLLLLTTLILFVIGALVWGRWASAATEEEDGPQRQTEILVSFTEYVWWLTQWEDNLVVCQLGVDHEGLPTSYEVGNACGEELQEQWLETSPCAFSEEEDAAQECDGLYLFFVSSRPRERTVVVELPSPTVWLTLENCSPTPPQNHCSELPTLLFTAEEPLPNERITAIHVKVGDLIYNCPENTCVIDLGPTNPSGEEIEFWASSSFGDESERFRAKVRIVDGGVSSIPGETIWLVDVISSQWRGGEVSSCVAAWEAFPPIGDPPHWLSTPENAQDLSSNVPYVFLAGQFIARGLVEASDCPQEGLLSNGAANACGLERARSMVNEWQNAFDNTILNVAKDTSIPAQLMKNLFAQESQFWPGEIIAKEFGLGQITSLGADAILLWNPTFFNQFCPLLLHQEECGKGYAHMDEEAQALLRGALAVQTDSTCPDCQFGINLTKAEFSVEVFAKTLLANCEQVSYIVYDTTNTTPGLVSTYEDLWRYTLVNYNAGPGCLTIALQRAWRDERTLTWETVSARMSEVCQPSVNYVERVMQGGISLGVPDFVATATPVILPTPTAPEETPSGSPTPAPTTPEGTPSSSPTPTTEAYPAPTSAYP